VTALERLARAFHAMSGHPEASATQDALQRIRERLDAATPGPWRMLENGRYIAVSESTGEYIYVVPGESNAIFIAAAREDVEALLRVAEAADGDEAQARALLAADPDFAADLDLGEAWRSGYPQEQARQRHEADDLGHKLGAWPGTCTACGVYVALTVALEAQP
jgi:hypothetical protein